MQTFLKAHASPKRILLFVIIGWVLLNALQAATLGVDADEAYYWLYARHLHWGYFDHPPVVALSIKLGELMAHGPFFTRLGTVLLSGGTLYFGWRLLPHTQRHLRLYLLSFASLVLLHVYGFIATPDAGLLFFAVLFFYAYRRFLQADTFVNCLLLALAITGLFYSKYHGVLPLLFTLLSNPRLLFKPSAWAVVAAVVVLFSPHLWWQYQHDFPTFRYHLSERIASRYRLSKTLGYIVAQLFIWGPFTTIPAFYFFAKMRQRHSLYERAHLFTFWGVLLFFLLSSLRSTIEPHWTLVAAPSFLVLFQKFYVSAARKLQQQLYTLLLLNVGFIFLLRLLFFIPHSPVKNLAAFAAPEHAAAWAHSLQRYTRGKPIVFLDSYKFPALYQYYNPDALTWDYNTVIYRKTQFNITGDAFLDGKDVVIATSNPFATATHFFETPYVGLYLQKLDGYKAVNAVHITWVNQTETPTNSLVLQVENTSSDTLFTHGLFVNYILMQTRTEQFTPPSAVKFPQAMMAPHAVQLLEMPLQKLPAAGQYKLIFSVVQPPLAGTFASVFYTVRFK